MGNLWLKIKIWTKIGVFVILLIAVLIFLFNNTNKNVTLWLWNDIDTTLLKVVLFTALISVILTILVGTTFRTVRQIKELRARNRSMKLEQDLADMKAKAGMLQTRPTGGKPIATLRDAIAGSPPPPPPAGPPDTEL